VQLVVSDAHAGLKAAIGQVLACPWQRCTVHFLRETLGHVRNDQQGMVAALVRPIFNADDRDAARELVSDALGRLRKPLPKVADLLEDAEEDLLAFYAFPTMEWPKLRSTNPLERVNREIGRRTDVVGIFPNDQALIRLATAVVIEQNDEWLVGHRYLSNHSLEAILTDDRKDNNRKETRELTTARRSGSRRLGRWRPAARVGGGGRRVRWCSRGRAGLTGACALPSHEMTLGAAVAAAPCP
jgi:putative transposase